MKKIDHVRKTVYIIVGILTIISLVFTLCKKIGLCASSETNAISFSPLPYLYGSGIGAYDSFNHSIVLQVVDDAITRNNSYNGETVVVQPFYFSSDNNYRFNVLFLSSISPLSNDYASSFQLRYSKMFIYTSDGTFRTDRENGNIVCNPNDVIEDINGSYYYKSNIDSNYPIYVYNDDVFSYNGNQLFSENQGTVGPQGHSKGGVLSNYVDSEDLLENSSDLPKVDTTPPADPSSNAGWFQKILNGIGRLNQSVQGGVLTIGDFIGAGIEKLDEKLSEVKDFITGLYGWFTEDFDKNQFQNGINSIPLISDLNGLKTLVENSGMFNWSDVTPAQSVSFTFDFGGAVLPHSSNTIDFSWYTGNVKTICNAILCTFLVLGLFVTVVNQIPSIIGGHSGDKGGGSDS